MTVVVKVGNDHGEMVIANFTGQAVVVGGTGNRKTETVRFN